jgi:hypothetical protein
LLILRIGIPVARAAATKRIEVQNNFKTQEAIWQARSLRLFVDSSNWDSGTSGCSRERIEIRQNLESDFCKQISFATSWILRFWRLVARTDKKKRNLTNAQTQKAIRQARSASPLRGFFDFGFWLLELQQRKDSSIVELLLFDRQRNLRWGCSQNRSQY